MRSDYGFLCSLNPTFGAGGRSGGHWIAKGYYGLDQGPVVLMIENFASGMTWDLMRRLPSAGRRAETGRFRRRMVGD